MEQHCKGVLWAGLGWHPRLRVQRRPSLEPHGLALQDPAARWRMGAEQTVFDAGTHNSYPTLIETSPGEFLAVWDSGTKDRHRTHIRFGKFKLPGGGS